MNDLQPEIKAAHDTAIPEALEKFLLTGWKPYVAEVPEAVGPEYASRRTRLGACFAGDHLVVPTGHEKLRANDTYYRFRPGSDFAYLTGNHEPDCVLGLEATVEGHRAILFVEPVQRDDTTFFSDRKKGELWVGRRLGVEGSAARFGLECRSLRDLDGWLGALQGTVRVLRGVDGELDGKRAEAEGDKELSAAASELRLLKDPAEIEALRVVIDATKRGFEDVIRGLKAGATERDAEVLFYSRARREGNDVGYGTIAAGGAHACTLHWTRNDAPLVPGELLLLDAGVEGTLLYTADITRTFPVNGRFSAEQRLVYELVLTAQREAMAMVKPGIDFMAPNKRAMQVLAEGLEALGVLPSAAEALKDEHQFYRRYSLHNISHMLGIDVHDCAKARQETYKFGQLKPGMVFTVEPGLYFQPDDLTVPERFRGIGVRIEDDIVVTADGYENLSAHIPSGADEVEAWMAQVGSGS